MQRILRQFNDAYSGFFSNPFKRCTDGYQEAPQFDLERSSQEDSFLVSESNRSKIVDAIRALETNDTTRKRQVRLLFGAFSFVSIAFVAYASFYLSQHPDDHEIHYNNANTNLTDTATEQVKELIKQGYNLTRGQE